MKLGSKRGQAAKSVTRSRLSMTAWKKKGGSFNAGDYVLANI